jgi:DNA polymerase I-like protein with 3'-5' exonuclease and polymerase domains
VAEQMIFGGADFDPHPWRDSEEIRLRSGRVITLRMVLVQDESALRAMETIASVLPWIAYDSETSGLFPWLGARICGHALAGWIDARTMIAWYVPVRHVGAINSQERQLDPAVVAPVIDRILRSPGRCALHHAKFDWSQLRADGVSWSSMLVHERGGIDCRDFDDISLMACIADENERSFALKTLGQKYITDHAADEQHVVVDWMKADAKSLGMKYKQRGRSAKADEGTLDEADESEEVTYLQRYGHSRVPLKLEGRYACHDVFLTLALQEHYQWIRSRYGRVYDRERAIECELHEMEWNGLLAVPEEIHKTHDLMKREVAHWITRVRSLIGIDDWSATDEEMRKLFYETWGCEVPKESEGGKKSVDKETRAVLARKHPERAPVLIAIDRLAKARKLRSTYASGFLRYVTPSNRIHPTYNQLEGRDEGGFPVTGRLSSSDPNIQNVAKKPFHTFECGCKACVEEFGNAPGPKKTISIRRYFAVPKGFVRAYIDYSQIELRILAWYSQDPKLLECYAQNLDVHAMVADNVTDGDRDIAKQVNFGNSYGMTAIGLARRVVWTDPVTGKKKRYYDDPEEAIRRAEKILEAYFQWLTGIPIFRANMSMGMRKNGCMFENPFGRPRRIPEIAWSGGARNRAERQMMSSIISGTAADLMKEGLLRVARYLRQTGAGILRQSIHDELVIDLVMRPGWAQHLRKLRDLMIDFPMFPRGGVPVLASAAITTTTWEEKREIELLDDGSFKLAA